MPPGQAMVPASGSTLTSAQAGSLSGSRTPVQNSSGCNSWFSRSISGNKAEELGAGNGAVRHENENQH